jgi:hypothetical protein
MEVKGEVQHNLPALSIQTTSQLISLTKAQKALLKTVTDCIKNKESLTMDKIVDVYYHNVRKIHLQEYGWSLEKRKYMHMQELDVMEEYKKNTGNWTYGIRSKVRQWFISNLGILVVKNQLIVVPVINIETE